MGLKLIAFFSFELGVALLNTPPLDDDEADMLKLDEEGPNGPDGSALGMLVIAPAAPLGNRLAQGWSDAVEDVRECDVESSALLADGMEGAK